MLDETRELSVRDARDAIIDDVGGSFLTDLYLKKMILKLNSKYRNRNETTRRKLHLQGNLKSFPFMSINVGENFENLLKIEVKIVSILCSHKRNSKLSKSLRKR